MLCNTEMPGSMVPIPAHKTCMDTKLQAAEQGHATQVLGTLLLSMQLQLMGKMCDLISEVNRWLHKQQ